MQLKRYTERKVFILGVYEEDCPIELEQYAGLGFGEAIERFKKDAEFHGARYIPDSKTTVIYGKIDGWDAQLFITDKEYVTLVVSK